MCCTFMSSVSLVYRKAKYTLWQHKVFVSYIIIATYSSFRNAVYNISLLSCMKSQRLKTFCIKGKNIVVNFNTSIQTKAENSESRLNFHNVIGFSKVDFSFDLVFWKSLALRKKRYHWGLYHCNRCISLVIFFSRDRNSSFFDCSRCQVNQSDRAVSNPCKFPPERISNIKIIIHT